MGMFLLFDDNNPTTIVCDLFVITIICNTIVLRGLRGALNCALIMPRDASLSDSRSILFQSAWNVKHFTYYIKNCTCTKS